MKNEEQTLLNVEEYLLKCRLVIDQLETRAEESNFKDVRSRYALLQLFISSIEAILGTSSEAKFKTYMKNLNNELGQCIRN